MTADTSGNASLLPQSSAVEEVPASSLEDLAGFLADRKQPVAIRGLASGLPIVEAGKASRHAVGDYLKRFYSGAPLIASVGPPDIRGRIGYDETLTGFNYQRVQISLSELLQRVDQFSGDPEAPAIYVGSSMLDHWFGVLLDKIDELGLTEDTASDMASDHGYLFGERGNTG